MVLSTRWLAPIALGAALLGAAPSRFAQDDAAQTKAAEPPPGAPAGGATPPAAAEDSAAAAAARANDIDRTPSDCVIVSNIRQTVVIDDQTILFYMRGRKEVYRNYLGQQCPHLGREGRFAYETRVNRLCNVDLITVIEGFGGLSGGVLPGGAPLPPGTSAGFTCRLGEFYPIAYEEAEILRKEKNHPDGPHGNAIKSKPAELPPEKSGAAAAPAPQGEPAR